VSLPTAATGVFTFGYLFTWAAAGVVAYGVIQGVRALDVSWLAWGRGGPYVAGSVIVAAAVYELTPAKSTSLRHCRNPQLLTRRWRPGASGALVMGVEHGGFCVGSSWALMAVLFAVGVMNVGWMIVLAGLVAIEKLLPWNRAAISAIAVFIAVLGIAVAFMPGHVPGLTIPG
jgi:predicted metal-binding membrane protein